MNLGGKMMEHMFESLKTVTKYGALALLLGIALGGCNKSVKIDPLAGGGGLTGNWVSSDNIFTAQLSDGSFMATANDNGALLSQGEYVVVSTTELRLSWTGSNTGSQNSAICHRPEVNLLNCTDLAGKSFTLRKLESTS